MIRMVPDFVVALSRERDHNPGARFDLLQVRNRFLVARHRCRTVQIAGRDDHHRQVFIDQRIRAVFHFSRRISFRMDIGDFL